MDVLDPGRSVTERAVTGCIVTGRSVTGRFVGEFNCFTIDHGCFAH